MKMVEKGMIINQVAKTTWVVVTFVADNHGYDVLIHACFVDLMDIE